MRCLKNECRTFPVIIQTSGGRSVGRILPGRASAAPAPSAPAPGPADILAVMTITSPQRQQSENATLPLGSTPLEVAIIKLLRQGLRDGEEMQRRLGTPISEFTIALTMLEINGVIRSLGANQWTLA